MSNRYNHSSEDLLESLRDIRKAREITKDLKGTDLGLPTDETFGVDITKTVVNVSREQIDENTKDWNDMETSETFKTDEVGDTSDEAKATLEDAKEFLADIGEDPNDDDLVVKVWQRLNKKKKSKK